MLIKLLAKSPVGNEIIKWGQHKLWVVPMPSGHLALENSKSVYGPVTYKVYQSTDRSKKFCYHLRFKNYDPSKRDFRGARGNEVFNFF